MVLKSKLDTIGDDKFNKHFYNLIVKGWELRTQPGGRDWKEDKSLEVQDGNEYSLGIRKPWKWATMCIIRTPTHLCRAVRSRARTPFTLAGTRRGARRSGG